MNGEQYSEEQLSLNTHSEKNYTTYKTRTDRYTAKQGYFKIESVIQPWFSAYLIKISPAQEFSLVAAVEGGKRDTTLLYEFELEKGTTTFIQLNTIYPINDLERLLAKLRWSDDMEDLLFEMFDCNVIAPDLINYKIHPPSFEMTSKEGEGHIVPFIFTIDGT